MYWERIRHTRRDGVARGIRLVLGVLFLTTGAMKLAVPPPASAQDLSASAVNRFPELVHEHWGIEDGLPLGHLTGVVYAESGYLWLSSYDGLIRFDGATFSVFNTSTNPELPTNRFSSVQEGPDGTIWAAAEYDYLVRWRDGRFDVFSLPGARGVSLGRPQFDTAGSLWLPTNRGLFLFRDEFLEPLPGMSTRLNAQTLFWDSDGSVWRGSDGHGALRWSKGTATFATRGDTVVGSWVTEFGETPGGTLLMGTGRGLVAAEEDRFELIPRPGGGEMVVRAIRQVSPDSFLVFSDRGLYDFVDGRLSLRIPDLEATGLGRVIILDTPEGNRWMATGQEVYLDDREVFHSEFPIAALALDREGSLWMAADGLHRLKPSIFRVIGPPEGARANVYAIMQDSRGRIWLGGIGDYIAIYDSGSIRKLEDGPTLAQTITEDRSGNIWVGRINYGACVLSGSICSGSVPYVAGHTVKAIFEDRSGGLWFGTDHGVYRDSAGVVDHWTVADGLPHDFVRVFHESRDGAIWMGTNGGGVARFAYGQIEAITTAHGLSSDLVRAIHEDEHGVLWIGTEDAGLNRFQFSGWDPDAGTVPSLDSLQITVIGREHGLYDEGVHAILDDGHGRYWMSTNRGIYWVLKTELDDFAAGRSASVHSIAYTERHGLRNREANGGTQSPAIVAADGRLWFATQAGAAVVDPTAIDMSDNPFPVRIESIRTEGEPHIVPEWPERPDSVRLETGQRDFSIAYTALSFLAPENLRFQYRLEGFQPQWVDVGNRRTAFFTNVPPGTYSFRVRAAREDGTWREAEHPAVLTVTPLFYETDWFKASMAGGVFLLGLAGVRVYEQRHRKRTLELSRLVAERTATIEAQSERLKELDAAKSRFFANISHDFRTPLTLTIGPLEDLKSGMHGSMTDEAGDQVDLSLRSARRVLRLVNQLMDVAKLEAGAVRVRASKQNLAEFVGEILQAFEPLAERRKIQTTFDGGPDPIPAFFDPELMERVFVNLLSNAFKFTPPQGAVRVTLEHRDADWLVVTVRDSGPGIDAEDLPHIFERFYRAGWSEEEGTVGTGIGLALAHDLVALHDGRLEVEATPGFGASFAVWLRSGSAHFAEDQLASSDREGGSGAKASRGPGDLIEGVDVGSAPHVSDWSATNAEDPGDEDIPTVLVVEDNPDVAAYLGRHLAPRFRVVEARDGAQGLEKARDVLPDVVVSDVMMPNMSGLELVKALQSDAELAYVPVLLVTARAGQEHRLEALEAGAADYLTKPFDVAELGARIHNLIASRQRLRDRLVRESRLHPTALPAESAADRFLIKLRETIETRMSDEDFDVRALARAMSESRSSLYRHLMDTCGQTPSEVLRSMRLERAAQLLEAQSGTIADVAYGVGFKSVSHFSRSFRDAYGVPPSAYADRQSEESEVS